MNILVADDFQPAIDCIVSMLDCKKLGVKNVFTASNSYEAMKILSLNTIEVMICDIEMPGMSGLELLRWIRNKNLKTVTVFLTSHADFNYAQVAVKLGGFDYLLKPVSEYELEQTILNAIKVYIKLEGTVDEQSTREKFFLDLIRGEINTDYETLEEICRKRKIDMLGKSYMLVLTAVYNDECDCTEDYNFSESKSIICNEMLFKNNLTVNLTLENNIFISIISEPSASYEVVKSQCEKLIHVICKSTGYNACCYLSNFITITEIKNRTTELMKYERRDVIHKSKVFTEDIKKTEYAYLPPENMECIIALLKCGKFDGILKFTNDYLEKMEKNKTLDANILKQFSQDFIQIVYYVLASSEIQAHLLFDDEESQKLFSNLTYSVTAFKKWEKHVLQKSLDIIDKSGNLVSVVNKAKNYINTHLDQQLSRNDVASYVYLNPDYLTRLFKKETGVSISQYINSMRINRAKDLLQNTDMSVSNVAKMVGFTHFAYFSTAFKSSTGYSPVEYRQMYFKSDAKVEEK